MSRKTRNDAGSARIRARRAAAQLKPAADQLKPLAKSTGEVAKRGVRRTRAWAAPQIERAGQVLQHSVAPKVSAVLSSAAQRINPAEPRHRRWPKPVGAATFTAAASGVAAFVRKRRKPGSTTAESGDVMPAGTTSDGHASAGTDADAEVNGKARTS